ncbi:MAG: YbaK/EbsC family protein [Actinomycetota bacterium]
MATGTERFLAAAAERGVTADVRHFPEGTRTAEDAARAVGCEIGQIVKSLVLMADDRALVALTSGHNQADLERVKGIVGARSVRRARPEEAREATTFAIGGTPPFGYPQPLRVLMDADLMAYDEVWAAAGSPDAVFPIDPETLRQASGAEIGEFGSRRDPHNPRV